MAVRAKQATEHADYMAAEALSGAERLVTWQDVEAVNEGCWFDADAAGRACAFFGKLKHSKGRWAGLPFVLLPWQRDVIERLFGWKRADGTRRFRRAYIEVPKKNGKSTFCAALALYLLVADGEPSAEVYGAASDREQASIVFREAARMANKSGLTEFVKIIDSTKRILFGDSIYHALSADAYRNEGLNISGLIFDELHAQQDRRLWDALIYGGISRVQPLMVSITTAGVYDETSICWEEHVLAEQVTLGAVSNTAYFALIFGADANADWADPDVWRVANPSFGETITERDLRDQCNEALASPAKQNSFKRYRLNIWTAQTERAFDQAAWDKCAGFIDRDALGGRACFGGLDLSSVTDLSAFSLWFPPFSQNERHKVLTWYWLPSDRVVDLEREAHAPYIQWAEDGYLELTDGNIIDYAYIRAKINALSDMYRIQEIAFDPYNATQIVNELQSDGFRMTQFRQGFLSMSPATKQYEKDMLRGDLLHDGNPITNWMISNCQYKLDPAGNVKVVKSDGKSRYKVDGPISQIMARGLVIVGAGRAVRSIYEDRVPG